MIENELYQYRGKNIFVVCIDEQKVKGFCSIVTQAVDNEPEVTSITLETDKGLIEITLPEIQSIEIIN